jgi:hypothetical protein
VTEAVDSWHDGGSQIEIKEPVLDPLFHSTKKEALLAITKKVRN